jgi:anti-sigma factor RsiW
VRVLRERFGHEAVRGRMDGVGDNAARQRVLKDARRQEAVRRRDDQQWIAALCAVGRAIHVSGCAKASLII